MNNVTYSAKKSEVERKWYIIDATDKPLGRVATEAARLLRGKHKPTFTPNIDTGDNVIIINCKDAKLTGNKMNSKIYRHHSGYIGGMKEVPGNVMLEKNIYFLPLLLFNLCKIFYLAAKYSFPCLIYLCSF